MATRVPNKWAIGEPMTKWCERNGFDAARIRDTSDAFTPARVSTTGVCEPTPEPLLLVEAWVILDDPADRKPGQQWREWGGGAGVEVLEVRPVDSPPPLNPAWAALFPEAAAEWE